MSSYQIWALRIFWALAALSVSLGSITAYAGPLTWLSALLLWISGFLSLLLSGPRLALDADTKDRWLLYLAGTAAVVVALYYFATTPSVFAYWYAGVASLLALVFAQQRRVGIAALLMTVILAVAVPCYALKTLSLGPSIEQGNAAHVNLMLRCGADPNQLRGHDLVLAEAVRQGQLEIVNDLLRHGADPNGRSGGFSSFTPVLFSAAGRDNSSVPILGTLLQKGADPNLRNGFGETALMVALRAGNTWNVEQLLEAGARLDAKNELNDTPWSLARAYQCANFTDLLLRHHSNRQQPNRVSTSASRAR